MIPKTTLKNILKNCGAERVSAKAIDNFQSEVEEYAKVIATESIRLAKHAGRKTVKSADISLAVN